jgi:hypothetical protein
VSEWVSINGEDPVTMNKTNSKSDSNKPTNKQIELLNKLFTSKKITKKMFLRALESKHFSSKIITLGIAYKPKFKKTEY